MEELIFLTSFVSFPTYFNELVSRHSKESKIFMRTTLRRGENFPFLFHHWKFLLKEMWAYVKKIFPWITIRDTILTCIYFWYWRECRSDTSLSGLSPAQGGGQHYFIFRAWTEQEWWTKWMSREVRQRKQNWWELGGGSMLNPCRALSYISNKWTCKFMHLC